VHWTIEAKKPADIENVETYGCSINSCTTGMLNCFEYELLGHSYVALLFTNGDQRMVAQVNGKYVTIQL